MTVSSSTNVVILSADGSTHSFAFTFKIFAASDLKVIVRSTAGVETVKTLNSHYIIADSSVGNSSGGNILFKYNTGTSSDAHYSTTDYRPASGEKVILRREIPQTQELDLVDNDPFTATLIEEQLDKVVMQIHGVQEAVDRSFKFSRSNLLDSSGSAISTAYPEIEEDTTARANKILSFDSTGVPIATQEIGTTRGNWAASTVYQERDIVRDTSTNNIFIVNTAHTSSGSEPLTTNANSAKYTVILNNGTYTNITASGTITGATFTASGVITGSTIEATGDTSSGDNAAIGYTSDEGLILTGQGAVSDVTVKNDNDVTVFTIPTGTDDILFPDNAKILIGSGSDLRIYHESDNSYIDERGSGKLYILSDTEVEIGNAGNATNARFNSGGSSILHYNNNAKFETSNTGATLTGTLTASSDIVTGQLALTTGNIPDITFTDTDGGDTWKVGIDQPNLFRIRNYNDSRDDLKFDGDGAATFGAALNVTGALTVSGGIADSNLNTITTADKVSAAAIQVDGATDGTSITIADTDKLLIDDGGTSKYINASQLNTYISASASSVAADNITVGDAAVTLTTTSGNITIDAQANNSDIILKGTDGSADTTFLTISGANAGAATFNSTVTATGFIIGSADINENDLEAIDGVTAGTVAASKVITVDANKDFTGARNMTATGAVTGGSLVADNITINGDTISVSASATISSTSSIILDAETDIYLDAKGDDIIFRDNGATFGAISGSSDNLVVKSGTSPTAVMTCNSANATFAGTVAVTGVLSANAGINIDNINIVGNNITTTDTNGSLAIAPNGSGDLIVNSDTMQIVAAESESATLMLVSDESDNDGDDWSFIANTDNTLTIGNDISGSNVAHVTITPHATVTSSTVAIAGGVTVGGNSTFGGDVVVTPDNDGVRITSTNYAVLRLEENDTTDVNTSLWNSGGDFVITTSNDDRSSTTDRFRIDHATGDISFYNSAGSAVKLHWDASADSLGIRTNVPDGLLHLFEGGDTGGTAHADADTLILENDGNSGMTLLSSTSGKGTINFDDAGGNARGSIVFDHSTDDLTIDATDDIIFDADSGAWRFKDGGHSRLDLTIGSGDSPTFYSAATDSDIVFKGNDGGSPVTALTLDMSEGGQVLVGKTSNDSTVNGVVLTPSGTSWFTATADYPLAINREGASDGTLLKLYEDNDNIGELTAVGDRLAINSQGGGLSLRTVGNDRVHIEASYLYPQTDDAYDVGSSGNRFDDVFATNGTIQTSDENEKQDIASMTTAELAVGKRLSTLFKTFKWKSKVTEKADKARTHSGIIAQQVKAAFEAESLDATKYALFCSDTWWEKEISVDAVEADEEKGIEAKDAYKYMDNKYVKTDGYSEKTRMGIRYPELLSFIASYNETRFTAIEARLTALEGS